MAENLSKVRQMKGLSLNQLASRSGIAIPILIEYEKGMREIPVADLKRLAKALYVDEWDINPRSTPPPTPPATPPRREAPPAKPKKQPAEKKPPPKSPPARESQISHLLQIAAQVGLERPALEAEIGKPLDELTQKEARTWNAQLMRRHAELRASKGIERKRAYLPEGVDGFELAYLQRQQEEAALLRFTLFDGQTFEGTVVGFSPYQITIRAPDGDEITLNKLAIAYYRRTGGDA